jgi:hypothetical protein
MACHTLSTRKEVADFLGIHPRTLRKWAARGEGPTPVLIGGRVMYRCHELVPADQRKERCKLCNCQTGSRSVLALLMERIPLLCKILHRRRVA